ncbi:hypothetical protein LGT41_0004680 [Abyssibius alkaniclasticus]|uniref:hypothetical protein n=2 Tax=Abyssibius alkaniclasticus TaxID=2881234 RepID=UPI0023648DA8|nr:hypothetical protein [Abyssibius alkaniclasticus]UPH72123.1 hypothetical protein LGT41_0004680 [Abyssibius alkaniclasticus]
MAKTPEIRAAKGDAKEADRHNLGDPVADAAKWVRGLTTKRVSDLFKTEKGLEGHWKQVQQEVTRGNKHFFATKTLPGGFTDGGKTSPEGKKMIAFIADAIVGAAKGSKIDFPLQEMKFTSDMAWLKLEKASGKVKVKSTPGTKK